MIFWRNFGKVCIQCDLSLTRRQLLPGLNLVRRQRLGEAKEPPWHSTAHLSTLNRIWTFWTREPLRIFDTFDIIWWYIILILCIMLGKVPQTNLRRSLCFGAPNVSVPRPNHPRRKIARCGQVPWTCAIMESQVRIRHPKTPGYAGSVACDKHLVSTAAHDYDIHNIQRGCARAIASIYACW